MKTNFIQLLLFVTLICGCSGNGAPTETQIPSSTFTPMPTKTSTLSPTSTSTLTPTLTATFTPTITPFPTSTPQGYYINSSAGFALTLPEGWELFTESPDYSMFISQDDPLFVYAGVRYDEYNDDIKHDIINSFGSIENNPVQIINEEDSELGGGISAKKIISRSSSDSGKFITEFYFVPRGKKFYIFVIRGPDYSIETRTLTKQRLLGSIAIFTDQIYGLSRNNTLVFRGYDPDPKDLDPALMTGSAEEYIGLIYSGLVRLSPELAIEPVLAESWKVSDDGLVYTFTLRGGLVFGNGKELTADDVRYSWERVTNPDVNSPTALTYLGDIVGVKEKLAGESDHIWGIEVIDQRNLKVTIDGPKPYFLAKLTYPTTYIVDQESVESVQKDWMYSPNSSGPFRLKEVIEEEALIFERNERYYSPAKIQNLVYLLYRAGSPVSLYEADEIDITNLPGSIASEFINGSHQLSDQLIIGTNMCTNMLSLNTQRAPLDDINVRNALIMAIDRGRMVEVLYQGMTREANSILPPAMPGYSQASPALAYNPQDARRSLEASKYYEDFPEIIFIKSGTSDTANEYVNFLLSMWKENLGIEITVEYLDPIDYSQVAKESNGHIVSHSWCADYPDPENFLDVLFHSQSDFNYANYKNPKIDELLEKARIELDIQKRLELYQEIEDMLLIDVAAIPLTHSISYTLVKPRVHGYVEVPIGVALMHNLELVPDTP